MRHMIPVYAALAVFAATQAGLVHTNAPSNPPSTSSPLSPRAARPTRQEQRFAAANTTQDGKLTLEQAKAARLATTVKHFAAMDRGAKGYLTLDDVKAASAAARATKQAKTART